MAGIVSCTDEFEEYLRDESRSVGSAESIVFPESEADVRDALHALHATGVPVTVQGARSGLAAGAVPHGGCVLNTSRMNRVLGMRRGSDGRFFVRVQPGLSLMELRDMLQKASFDTTGWNDESLAALAQFKAAPAQFFAPDPTEASAALGGIVACNASGSRSYAYGAARPHVEAMRVALADGDALALRRGEVFATGRELRLVTEGDLLFSFFLQCLAVGMVMHGCHRGGKLKLFQAVPKLHQSRSSAAAAISREINAGILTCGRCSLGSLILCREKEFSFGFPACSVICSRCRAAFSSSSICVWVGNCDIRLLMLSNRSVCRSAWYHSASRSFIIRSQSTFAGRASGGGACTGSAVCWELRCLSSCRDNLCSDSEFTFHGLLAILFFV